MSTHRIFVSSKLTSNQEIVLDSDASNHVVRVLRLKINENLIVFNGQGGEFNAVLKKVFKNQAVVSIKNFIQLNNESPLQIHLAQGISRREKMDFTIQKSVELGVNTITPIFTKRCNTKLENDRLDKRLCHWKNVAISASEQSGRCYVPKILEAQSLEDWIVTTSGMCLVLDPYTNNKINDIKETPNCLTILVGPEGGLSDEEVCFVKKKKFIPIQLGPRILRTETAALTMISILQTKWGDF